MKENKNKTLLIILGTLIVTFTVIGVSYAVWRLILSQTNKNSLATTCFSVSMTDSNAISLEKAYPIIDEEGKKLTPYTFTITNNCDSYVKYEVNLELLNTSTLTNMDYIKLMLDDETPAVISSYGVTTKTISDATTAYKIKTGYLDANESKTYNLRLWVDESVTMTTEGIQNRLFESKITVTASYAKELPEYCELHPETMACQVTTLAKTDTTNLATDEAGNVRYIGADPNNYVSIDGDIWRIIGTMKDIDDGTGNKSDRVKLIRASSIGSYSWDTSESSVNGGYGVNEWSQADLMKLLNPGYESETVGGSLYWNNQSGTCYRAQNNGTTSCNFTSTGIKEKLKNMIGNAVWNTGSNGSSYSYDNIKTAKFYELERSSNTGKICSSGNYCNDTVERTTTWTGKVGLMYPSDYGYATSGGSTTDRATCLNKELYNWDNSSVSDCKNNDWLLKNSWQWTISPIADSSDANIAFYVSSDGSVCDYNAYDNNAVLPVVYLTSNVGVQSGDGSLGNPFILS